MKTREQILSENPITTFLEARGFEFRRFGNEMACLCPLHEDKSPSFRVNTTKATWFCDPCGVGGTIIDLVMRLEGVVVAEAMKRLAGDDEQAETQHNRHQNGFTNQTKAGAAASAKKGAGTIVATYDYHDAAGEVVYQVVRMEPKDFRQRRMVDGSWSWSLEGVQRVLFRLPKIMEAEYVWVVEGEKDVLTLEALGLTATCNAGGAGKWQDSYSEALRGKEVILCGDNDEPGQKHMAKVEAAIAGTVKSSRRLRLPDDFKDVTDYLASFAKRSEGAVHLVELAESVEPLTKGLRIPIQSMAEMERDYIKFAQRADLVSLSLGQWIPGLTQHVRPLVPGEVVTIVAETGVGKTMLLQNLALHTRLPTLMFELELPGTLTFERFAGMAARRSGGSVQSAYALGGNVDWRSGERLDHVYVCSEPKMPPAELERIIRHAGLKIGTAPRLVLVDYVQLIRGEGNDRYEDASDAAEELKRIAKATDTIIVLSSQVKRRGDKAGGEIFLQDAKGSGSIENSSGLVLGAWRDSEDKFRLYLKVCKNTKGMAGKIVPCRIREGSMEIAEETTEYEPSAN